MAKYNGHPSYNAWNVSLWINNDEGLCRMAQNFIARYPKVGRNKQAKLMLERLLDEGVTHTPDGVRYTVTNIQRAMVGM